MASMSRSGPATTPFDTPANMALSIDYSSLSNKVALVTGGASGLGEGFVKMLAAHGARVIIVDYNASAGGALEAELTSAGHAAKFIQCDVTSWEAQVTMFRDALAWAKCAVDIVITCAGITGQFLPLEPRDPSMLANAASDPIGANTAALIETNLLGSLYTAKLAVLYAMGAHLPSSFTPGSKSIVLVASMGGYGPMPYAPDYSTSKYGVRGAFHSLKARFWELGIRANLLAPYYIETPMTQNMTAGLVQRGVQLGRLEDVVDAAARMITNDEINGRVVCVTKEGASDIGDDIAGGNASAALKGFAERNTLVKPAPAA